MQDEQVWKRQGLGFFEGTDRRFTEDRSVEIPVNAALCGDTGYFLQPVGKAVYAAGRALLVKETFPPSRDNGKKPLC